MKYLSLFILLVCVGLSTADFTCGLKTKSITKLQNQISKYLQPPQYAKLLGFIEKDILSGVDAAKIFDNFTKYLLNSFTLKQTTEVASKGIASNNEMEGMDLNQLLAHLGEGLRENLQNFVQKLVKKAKKMKAKLKADNVILKSGYKLVYNFITKKKSESIMCNIRGRFTDQQWGVIYKHFGVCFHFDNYALSPDTVKTRIFNGCENYERIPGITVEFPPEFKGFRRPWVDEFRNIKLFSSEALTYNWIWLKELHVKGLKTTFAEFLNLLEKNNCLFISYGESIYEICRKKFGIYKCGVRPTKEYDRVTFGVPDDNDRFLHAMIDPIIVRLWNSTFNRPKTQWEFTANTVGIYDNTAGKVFLVDMTGRALRDICRHVIDFPVVKDNWPLWASGNLVKILRYYNLVADGFYGRRDVREFIVKEVKKNFNKTKFQEYYCRFVLDGVFVLNSEGDTVTSNCYSNHPDDRRKRAMKLINDKTLATKGDFNFEFSTKSPEETPRIPETEPPLVAQPMEDYDVEGDIASQKSEDYAPYGVD